MPDQLNKQALVNLLIDSPLREPIKINLIDIVNNTTDPDLPKVFPTIVKELEIFQKATERRMKLAEETITKLGGPAGSATDTPSVPPMSDFSAPASTTPDTSPADSSTPGLSVPPLDLPPMPTSPALDNPSLTTLDTPTLPPLAPIPEPATPPTTPDGASATTSPPAPSMPSIDSSTPLPVPTPLGGSTPAPQADEDALAEIQKELDSLKTSAADEVASAATPAPATPPDQK